MSTLNFGGIIPLGGLNNCSVGNVTSADARITVQCCQLGTGPIVVGDLADTTGFDAPGVDRAVDAVGVTGSYVAAGIPQIESLTITVFPTSNLVGLIDTVLNLETAVGSSTRYMKYTWNIEVVYPSTNKRVSYSRGILFNAPSAASLGQRQGNLAYVFHFVDVDRGTYHGDLIGNIVNEVIGG